ncbi:MAG: sigma-70 family RNA polymerase sigma factor [Bacilli bacterium]
MLDKHMQNFRDGDIDALDHIYEETKNLVFSICLSYMQDYMLAEDMMQDTYIRVRKYIEKYKHNTNPKAWISKIAKNTCLNEIKKRKRINLVSDVYDMDDISDERKERTPLLDIALKILKPKELLILLPHIIDNKKLVDIAKELNIPEGTVRWKYSNSLSKIRKYLERSNLDEIY